MKHKLVIYGNNMYKEVDFDDSFAGSITIGTDKACQIAFRKDRFMTGFIFRIDRQGRQMGNILSVVMIPYI